MVRRAAARVLRRIRTGFTASEVHVWTEAGCLLVAVTGRDLDNLPRSIEFQTADAADPDYDAADDEGYCLVNERHIPVFQALETLRLSNDRIRLTLTRAAAHDWELPSTILTIKLRMTPDDVGRLRAGLRRLFDVCSTELPRELRL